MLFDDIELEVRGLMPTGEQMRKGRPLTEFDPVYMEHRALAFLRTWPDVPEDLRPVYSRFFDAGLIFVDTNAPEGMSYPGKLRLTALGHRVREVMMGKQINFFRLVDVFALIPVEKLADRDKHTTFYMRLWRQYDKTPMDWNDQDMRRYISLRLAGHNPAEGEPTLRERMDKLRAAVERLTFHTQMVAYRAGGLDDDIPF